MHHIPPKSRSRCQHIDQVRHCMPLRSCARLQPPGKVNAEIVLNDRVAQVGVWLGAVVEAALFDQAKIWQLGHDVWVLSAKALDKSSRAALSHCVVDSRIEDIVHDDVGTDSMMTLVARPAETVNEIDRHCEEFLCAYNGKFGVEEVEVGCMSFE